MPRIEQFDDMSDVVSPSIIRARSEISAPREEYLLAYSGTRRLALARDKNGKVLTKGGKPITWTVYTIDIANMPTRLTFYTGDDLHYACMVYNNMMG